MNPNEFKCYHKFDELPLLELERASYAVYIFDLHWNYIFINSFGRSKLDARGADLIGLNLWKTFPELANDGGYFQLKREMEHGRETKLILRSPLTNRRTQVCGRAMEDCYFFCSSVLFDKDNLLMELRSEVRKSSSK